MLIRFTVNNYLSFGDEQSLNLLKGKSSKLLNHLNDDDTGGFKTLRGAVVYGSNASGKSNLIRAMEYAREFIVQNKKSDRLEHFKLDPKASEQPSSFNFEFKTEGKAYSYGFESRGSIVFGEWLYEISAGKEDKLLFIRRPKSGEKADIEFGSSTRHAAKLKAELKDLDVLARHTPDDTLFLYDTQKRNLGLFKEVYDWFKHKLTVLKPSSIEPYITKEGKLLNFLERILKAADVGIAGIELAREEDFSILNVPRAVIEKAESRLTEDGDLAFIASPVTWQRVALVRENGKLCSYRLLTTRLAIGGEPIKFELSEESDGTRRLIDLAGAFLSEDGQDKVLVIDELDRSLHPMITEMFHDLHYNDKSRINAQLILATHEHYLLSQAYYRRDEIWFMEKNEYGMSRIKSLSEFQVRFDKDIERDYLAGRYGATPYVRKVYA